MRTIRESLVSFAILHRSFTRKQLTTWSSRAGYTMADQAVFSGANFSLNVILVRWLPAGQYGAFAIAFAVFLFLTGFHNALIQEPASILGAAESDARLPTYLGELFWLHLCLTSSLAILIIIGSLFMRSPILRDALWAMGLATPVILLEWLLRRACYLRSDARGAFLSSCVYAVLLLSIALLLHHVDTLSPGTAFGAMAVASLGGVSQRWRRLRVQVRIPRDPIALHSLKSVFQSHWAFGRWVSMQAILILGSTYIQTFATGWLVGLEGAGVLRALGLLSLPISQVMNAIGSVLGLPLLARKYAEGDKSGFRRSVNLLVWFFLSIALLYELGLIICRGPLAAFLLQGDAASLGWLIPLIGIGPIITALSTYGLALRAGRQLHYYPICGAASAIAGILSAPILIVRWELAGAVASSILVSTVTGTVSWYLYHHWKVSSTEQSAAETERSVAGL